MGAGPRQVVQAPAAAAGRYGLIPSARIPDDPDDRWQNGLVYEPEACGDGYAFDPCAGTARPVDEAAGDADNVDYEPFGVGAEDRCSTFGFQSRDTEARARRRLLAIQGFQIEREFWEGAVARAQGHPSRFLAFGAPVDIVTPTGPVDPATALACLEQGLAECYAGQRGMIHATPQVVSLWDNANLVRRDGALVLTALDTIVVPGAGYTGSDPNRNVGNGNVWAYATGMVDLRLGDIEVHGHEEREIDRDVNTRVTRAERLVAATWDGCCHSGARIDIDLCGIGGS